MAFDIEQRILIVGFGNMGRALVRGWLDAGMDAASLSVSEQSRQAQADAMALGLQLFGEAANDGSSSFDLIVLAVKPQQVDDALQSHIARLSAHGVVLSVAAGVTISSLQQSAGHGRAIVRTMPNTPAAIAQGTTVLCANAAVTAQQREICGQLLGAVGAIFWVDDEAMLDAVTAVSGSGPAYVFLLMECLTAAGMREGLPERLAADLARHTVAGAGAYARESQSSPSELREQVTSPGGTTAAALAVLRDDDALQKLFDRAVAAAAARSAELSSG